MGTVDTISVIQEMVYLDNRDYFLGRRTSTVVQNVDLDLDNVPEDEIGDLYPLTEVEGCNVHMDIITEYLTSPNPYPYSIKVQITKIELEFVVEGDLDEETGDTNFRRRYEVTIEPPFTNQRFRRVDEDGFIDVNEGIYFSDIGITIDMAGGSDTDNWSYEIDVGGEF